jgi:hypothetical protein
VKLVTNEQVVEVVEFETTNPALRGDMTITITLADADGGTDLLAVHDGLPGGLSTAENETDWRMSLAKLAALAEAGLDGTATPKSGHKKRPNKRSSLTSGLMILCAHKKLCLSAAWKRPVKVGPSRGLTN